MDACEAYAVGWMLPQPRPRRISSDSNVQKHESQLIRQTQSQATICENHVRSLVMLSQGHINASSDSPTVGYANNLCLTIARRKSI